MTAQAGPVDVDPGLLPILGEPFAVELANTLYNRPGAAFDFLATRDWMTAWFDHADTGSMPRPPRHVDHVSAESIRSIRNAMHAVLTNVTANQQPPPATIATLNNAAGRAAWRVRLEWQSDTAPVATTAAIGRGIDTTIASIAVECIRFVASPLLAFVHRCEGPDCPMFFVQHHQKRRFCHDGCAHRARQSRYYRNHHPLPTARHATAAGHASS